jgi:uncharacterized repeat protein (TIGR03809 family)
MTDAIGTLRDYQVIRWRKLAERRLEHMTELLVSGRWQRYFDERDFVETVRQSKALVEIWRTIEPRGELDGRLPHAATKPLGRDLLEAAAVVAPAVAPPVSVRPLAKPAVLPPATMTDFRPQPMSLPPSPFEDAPRVVPLRPRRP